MFLKVHYMVIILVKNSLLQNPLYKGSAQFEHSASSQVVLRRNKCGVNLPSQHVHLSTKWLNPIFVKQKPFDVHY